MRRGLLLIAVAALAWAAIVAATAGMDWNVAGVPIRSRDPGRALAVALIAVAASIAWSRAAFVRYFDRARAIGRRFAPLLAVTCAAAIFAAAVRFGIFAVGGADSYGYVSEAYLWARGPLPRPIP